MPLGVIDIGIFGIWSQLFRIQDNGHLWSNHKNYTRWYNNEVKSPNIRQTSSRSNIPPMIS